MSDTCNTSQYIRHLLLSSYCQYNQILTFTLMCDFMMPLIQCAQLLVHMFAVPLMQLNNADSAQYYTSITLIHKELAYKYQLNIKDSHCCTIECTWPCSKLHMSIGMLIGTMLYAPLITSYALCVWGEIPSFRTSTYVRGRQAFFHLFLIVANFINLTAFSLSIYIHCELDHVY